MTKMVKAKGAGGEWPTSIHFPLNPVDSTVLILQPHFHENERGQAVNPFFSAAPLNLIRWLVVPDEAVILSPQRGFGGESCPRVNALSK